MRRVQFVVRVRGVNFPSESKVRRSRLRGTDRGAPLAGRGDRRQLRYCRAQVQVVASPTSCSDRGVSFAGEELLKSPEPRLAGAASQASCCACGVPGLVRQGPILMATGRARMYVLHCSWWAELSPPGRLSLRCNLAQTRTVAFGQARWVPFVS